MSFCLKDYLGLKTTEKQQTPKKHSAFTPVFLKAEHKIPFVTVSPSPAPGREGPRRTTLKLFTVRDNSRL